MSQLESFCSALIACAQPVQEAQTTQSIFSTCLIPKDNVVVPPPLDGRHAAGGRRRAQQRRRAAHVEQRVAVQNRLGARLGLARGLVGLLAVWRRIHMDEGVAVGAKEGVREKENMKNPSEK